MFSSGSSGTYVRARDPDRFLISLFAPADRREALWALLAFNHEIARTREVVSETTLGLIRLQWWRDEIGKVYGGGPVAAHEVLTPLAAAIREYGLKREDFETLLYAREFDLEDVPPETLAGMEKYADFTNAPLLRLAVRIAGEEGDAPEALSAIATAYGLTGLLRAVPYHARARRCLLPADLMARAGVGLESLYALKPAEGLPGVGRTVAERAQALLRTAGKPRSRLLKAHAALAGQYLGRFRRAGYDPFGPLMAVPPPLRELRLFLAVNSL